LVHWVGISKAALKPELGKRRKRKLSMRRRDFLTTCAAVGLGVCPQLAERTAEQRTNSRNSPREIGIGPQLFLDDYLIDRIEGLKRVVQQPERLAEPILNSKTFGTTQPYLTVLYDRDQKRFRIWYNRGPAIWHAESKDGLRWIKPRVAWDLARSYGASLVDDGASAVDPKRRYKLANWQATRSREDKTGDDAGMHVGFSPDGYRWTAYNLLLSRRATIVPQPVLNKNSRHPRVFFKG
jgi:hypothetical protein